MKKEIELLIGQLKDSYEGEPWFGRNAKALLGEVDEEMAFQKLHGQHSILELVWHMCTWREFTIHCLQASSDHDLKYFEKLDWRELNHTNRSLWQEGLAKLETTQTALLSLLQQQEDSLLEQNVSERQYNYRKLLNGIIQHDIYHLGQIAYVVKLLRNR